MIARGFACLVTLGAVVALGGCFSYSSQNRLYDTTANTTSRFPSAGPELRIDGPCYAIEAYGVCVFSLSSSIVAEVERSGGSSTDIADRRRIVEEWRVIEIRDRAQEDGGYTYALLRVSDVGRIRSADDLFSALIVPTTANSTSSYVTTLATTGDVDLASGQVTFRDRDTLEHALMDTINDFRLIAQVQDRDLRCAMAARASFEAGPQALDCAEG